MIRTIVVVAAVIALAGVACAESRTITELRAAADKGDIEALVALGDRYRFGDGVSQDDVKAAKWYRLAADQGHAKAQFELGVMYYYGWGVSQDNADAAHFYLLAAEQGNAEAQLEIGLMYRYGEGVTKDYISAYAWLILAADRDEVARYAAREIEDLVSLLTTEQVTEAKRMARELRAQIKADSVVEGPTSHDALAQTAEDQQSQPMQGSSPTCGPLVGEKQHDVDRLQRFCNIAVPDSGLVIRAFAKDTLLWVKVTKEIALYMVGHRLETEQLVFNWMASWKVLNDSSAVTIVIEWGDVEIARGQTSLLRGDRVTIKSP